MIGDTLSGFTDSIVSFLQTPFNSRGSALNWVLWVGLLISAIWFWQVVLIDLQKDI